MIRTMPKVEQDGKSLWFWYSNDDPYIDSLQSTYLWSFSRLQPTDRSVPGMPRLGEVELKRLAAGGEPWLAMIGRSKEEIETGLRALRQSGFVLSKLRHSTHCADQQCVETALGVVETIGSMPQFPGLDERSQLRVSHELVSIRAASFASQLAPKLYGKLRKLQILLSSKLPSLLPRFEVAELMPEGYVRFNPTTTRDFLATDFRAPKYAAMGGSKDFKLRVEHDPRFVPSPRCRIQVQDHRSELLSEFGCSDLDEPARVVREKVFRLSEIPRSMRVVIRTNEFRNSALPVRVDLAQAVSQGG
jgi:hypothetical protein